MTQTILAALQKYLETPNLDTDTTLEALGLDSLDTIELLIHVAEATGLDYTRSEIARLVTLGDVIALFGFPCKTSNLS